MAGLDPNASSQFVSSTLNIIRATKSGPGPLFGMVLGSEFHNNFAGRSKTYTGTGASILAQMQADGFVATDSAFEMAEAALEQSPTPSGLAVGKREAGDASWGASMAAIVADLPLGESPDWYGWYLATRDDADLISIADQQATFRSPLTPGPLFFVVCATKSPGVISAAGGNVVEQIKNSAAADYVSVGWSDVTRVQTFAEMFTKLETFNLAPVGGVPVVFTIEVTQVGGSPLGDETVLFAATQATFTGTGPGPTYAFADGEFLDLQVDTTLGPFRATWTGTAASQLGTVDEPYAPTGETFQIATETTALTTITLTAAETTRALAAAKINLDLGEVIATDGGTGVLLTSNVEGSSSLITVVEGTGGAALLGLSVGTLVGTGNVADLSAVTITEVITQVQAALGSNAVAADSSDLLQVTSNRFGTGSALEALASSSANVLTELGFLSGQTATGTGFASDASAATAAEVEVLFDTTFTGVTNDSATGKVVTSPTTKGEGSQIQVKNTLQRDLLTLTSSGAGNIGFSYDGFIALTVASVDVPTDAAALKALFDATGDYSSRGICEVVSIGGVDFLLITWSDRQTHVFVDQSDGTNAVTAAQATDATQNLGITSTLFQGAGVVELWADVREATKYISAANPPLAELQRPVDFNLVSAPDQGDPLLGTGRPLHSALSKQEIANAINEGAWVLNTFNQGRMFGSQMTSGIKWTTRVTGDLIQTSLTQAGQALLNNNADNNVFVPVDQKTIDRLEALFRSVVDAYVQGNHVTPLKDQDDPTFDASRDGSIVFPRISSAVPGSGPVLTPTQIQQGEISGIEVSLVAKAQAQKIDFTINLVAAVQAAL